MSLQGKKILIGISGSIAAYKIPLLVRLLIKSGAEVKVVLTPSAIDFVSPLTLSTLSKNTAIYHLVDNNQWSNHVMLGRWADLMVIAPATSHTIAKMANGLCDNLLMAVYLSATCPVVIAPAMDDDMYQHPTLIKNINSLASFPNHHILPVEEGELASGLIGKGRLLEIEKIHQWISSFFLLSKKLKGKKIVITAGPTYELIDPVRFIGNFSTGKMGIALANKAVSYGAEVFLILGPTHLKPATNPQLHIINVTSAKEMMDASLLHKDANIIICAAAVADYRPMQTSTIKIKKSSDELVINLIKNDDILKTFGSLKNKQQVVVGFALETNNELENATKKLKTKKADLIVLNSLQSEKTGFGFDTNQVTLISQNDKPDALPLLSKTEVANIIIDKALHIWDTKNNE